MVAGRFINAYSRNDWMLGVAFRARYMHESVVVEFLQHCGFFQLIHILNMDSSCIDSLKNQT